MKLEFTRDGIFEFVQSVPTPAQREKGIKLLRDKLKGNSRATSFLQIDLEKEVLLRKHTMTGRK